MAEQAVSALRKSSARAAKLIAGQTRRRRALALAALAGFACAVHAAGQTDECAASGSPPGDAALHLSLKDGQSVFREGEIVALTAEYTVDTPNKYIADNRNYDRSGRLSGMEDLCIAPDHGVDPLYDYFHSLAGFGGGGLSSERDPARKPLKVDLELNEWETLPPGSYQLSIVGNRLRLGSEADVTTWHGGSAIALHSNTVDFQVEAADPGWQAAQLSAALTTLDSADSSEEDKKHAARVLRFLGSEASTRELAHRFSPGKEPFSWDFKFGLFASPHRQLAIREMKAALVNPEHPVTREFVDVLVMLEMQSDPKLRLPAYDENNKEAWAKLRDAYYAEQERRAQQYMAQAAASAGAKDPSAMAMTASEILQSDTTLSADARTRWRQALLANLSSLPMQTQNELIAYRWDQVGGPEWLPVLEAFVAGPPNALRDPNKPNRQEALRQILAIAPTEGRKLAMQEIANPRGDTGISVLGKLPERELPQFEAVWIEEIRRSNASDVHFQLIDRFASPHALTDLKAIYEAKRGQWACAPQTSLLRYFLRVSPDYGVKEVSAALTFRKTTGCFRTQLSDLKEFVRLSQVEQIAIAALNDSSVAIERDAAQALQHYGSANAEPALWARLEKFHRKWKDDPDELHARTSTDVFEDESGLDQVLVQSITNAQGWLVDSAAIERARELSGPAMQPSLDGMLQQVGAGEFDLTLSWWPGDLNFTVGWYSGNGMADFRQKLAQFPAGSWFRMVTTRSEQELRRAEFAEVETAAAASGQRIEFIAGR